MFERLHLTVAVVLAFFAGAVVSVGSLAVFGAMTEDVTQHDGQALRDAADLRFFTVHRNPIDVRAAKIVTELGSVPVLIVVAVLAALLLWWRGQRLVVALAPVASLTIAAAIAALAKAVIGRSRPPAALHLVAESDPSFPSGHATNSTAAFMAIAFVVAVFVLRRPLARVAIVFAAGLAASAVAASRLVLGVHWPSDVIAGLALGLLCALTVTIVTALFSLRGPIPANVAGDGVTQLR